VIEATQSGDCRLIRIIAKKISPGNFRLLQQYLPQADISGAASWSLLDHLVGGDEQLVRHGEAERPGRLDVDDELELGRLYDR
jgi:hypothetical protein